MGNKKKPEPARIGVLSYPGAQAAAVHGLVDLFATARHLHDPDRPALEPQLLRAGAPGEVPERCAAPLAALVMPPSLGARIEVAASRPLVSWIADRHGEGTLVCAVCAGVFLLAETGLLGGRPATTHWALGAAFAARYPDVVLDTSKILIDDGDVVTAGGMMAWIDLGLMLIERFLGPTVMLATARQWVVDPGGREQRFYSTFAPVLTHGDAAILRVQHFMHSRSGERLSLNVMAREAKMSERTFLRRFERATGQTPMEYLHHLRVERAREQLERSTRSFDEIAYGLGYDDAGAFRRVFVRVMGLTPGEYRRRFRIRTGGH